MSTATVTPLRVDRSRDTSSLVDVTAWESADSWCSAAVEVLAARSD